MYNMNLSLINALKHTTAFHEASEILLARLDELCFKENIKEWEVIEGKHRIIRKLENSIFDMLIRENMDIKDEDI